ncbi:ArpU family phage packaging/lysis transcriptional regulator [Pediococcus claussenii]|uniref:ArpU family phage packaging/lysis transcriptional regulator n=1 Tax=Pediococcus claussenii TaxID=187452 RepID=UPI00081A8751|nr:ArpU family phage packaging/lysis transcriptional regulator [Pediococcus claussenii]ANZ70361.1 hypothetical protein AYR57_08550 [Pediococcus claussenii]ANZ72177.1 hypothetical protein AYR58_08550 [Pediococcus claussenii]
MSGCTDRSKKELMKCRSLMRTAGKRLYDLQSPVIDDMPSNSAYGNQVEEKIIRQIDAKKELEDIRNAIVLLSDDERDLIKAKYLDMNAPSDRMVMGTLFISNDSTYYRMLDKALYHFAQSFRAGELLFVGS